VTEPESVRGLKGRIELLAQLRDSRWITEAEYVQRVSELYQQYELSELPLNLERPPQ
jgi:hypothetical protein